MSNNYDDGYQAGLRGEPSSGSGAQGIAGYMAGQAAREQNQPKTNVDGVGFTALICAPLVCMLYPVAGAAAAGALGLTWTVAYWLRMTTKSFHAVVIVALLLALVAFFLGFAVEKRLARGKMYRILRDCYRIALGAAIPISMLMTTGRNTPSGGAILFAIAIVPIGYWIVKRIDRAVGAGGET